MRHEILTTINGESIPFEVWPNDVLLDVLRTRVGVKSPKIGCERGDCGSCTVLLDGKTVRSCLVLAVEVDGHEITTVEGIAEGDGLHPIQQKFLENAALQCGICTPGLIVATKALLDKDPNPDEKTIRYWIAGNLCRCTGYDKIVRAIQDAAEELAHPA